MTTVTIRWNGTNANIFDGYSLYKGESPSSDVENDYDLLMSGDTSTTLYQDEGNEAGSTHFYALVGERSKGNVLLGYLEVLIDCENPIEEDGWVVAVTHQNQQYQ